MIAGYFVNGMKTVGGCAQSVRCDMGTENRIIERIRTSLQELFNEDVSLRPCLLYGKNQRIAAWWSIFRKDYSILDEYQL